MARASADGVKRPQPDPIAYVVLQEVTVVDESGESQVLWRVAGETLSRTQRGAITAHLKENGNAGGGRFAAVTARSFKPVSVQATQRYSWV